MAAIWIADGVGRMPSTMIDPQRPEEPVPLTVERLSTTAMSPPDAHPDHAPTAGETAPAGCVGGAIEAADPTSSESQKYAVKPPTFDGFLATLLRPANHRGGRRMSKRNVGEI